MIRRLAALCILFSLLASPATAQEATEPLLDMLARVPDSALHVGSLVSYVDYRTVESARPGAARPRSTEEWMALRDAGEASLDLWLTDFYAVTTGSIRLREAFSTAGEEWPSLLGFDFFDVDRELHFGNPPDDGLVLAGTFDRDTIAVAHAARGFTSTDAGDWALLCGAAGCDEGYAIDFDSREPADPFGWLGRQQPLLISDDTLLSSASLDTVEAMRDTTDRTRRSLADDPAVRTALGVIPDDAMLRQVTLVPWELPLPPDFGSLLRDATTDEGLLLGDLERFALEPILPYRLALLADTATPDEQVTYVVLLYYSEDDARSAAAVLPGRIDTVDSILENRPLRELFDDQGVTDIEVGVHVGPEGSGAATVLELHAPLPSSDLTRDPAAQSSLPYRLLVEMVLSRDVSWLATSGPSGLGGD